VPLRDSKKPFSYMGLVWDVTEVKLSQERLREYAEQLRKAVEERSGELLEAERMATAGRVSSMVGHDLRSPLQSIKNAAYMIKQKPELTPKMLEVIGGAVDRSLRMLDELRQMTREEPLALEPTDIGLLVDAVVREIPRQPNVKIRVESAEVPSVPMDSLKMRRVVENILNNALESMKSGGEIVVSLAEKGGHIVLVVKDQGRGIEQEAMAQIFKPFYTTKPGGMGLGLAFCKWTVEAHGGTIRLESAPGKGTTVYVSLPMRGSLG
jgi:two-component system sensor histidine kinase HydH